MSDQITKLKDLGAKAYRDGKTSIPIHDNELMSFVKREDCTYLFAFKFWLEGWHKANLADGRADHYLQQYKNRKYGID